MTTGSPPSITETHEFVVPRSIPMTLGIVTVSSAGALITALGLGKVRGALGHRHQGWTKQRIMEPVAWLVLLDDGVGLMLGAFHMRHGLVLRRVEARPFGIHAGDSMAGQDIEQPLQDQGHALYQ